jgi:formate dehydrogenase major subunit
VRERFERAWNLTLPPKRGLHLSAMFEAMEHDSLKALYIIGENPVDSEADRNATIRRLAKLDVMVVQDIFLTATAEAADVVLPAAAGWCESEGTVTSSERRVQRVRRALEPPAGARDDIEILCEVARHMGKDFGNPTAEDLWNEVRRLSPMHAGMSYERLERLDGIQWPCYDESHPGETYLHGRLWRDPIEGPRAPFSPVEFAPPVDVLDADYPLRLTTGRTLDSYNTGVQTAGCASPLRNREALSLTPEDAKRFGVTEGERVRVSSRRGSVVAPVRLDPRLRPGLAFMTVHCAEDVPTNNLTNDAYDPKSGTSEFKATAIRIERLI